MLIDKQIVVINEIKETLSYLRECLWQTKSWRTNFYFKRTDGKIRL